MCLKFHGAFNHVWLSGKSLVVIVEDPKLGCTIVSACSEQAVLEWRPGHVVDVSLMTLDERCICIKGKGAVGIKDSNCRGGIPCDGDHLTVSCTTIVLVRVRRGYTIESCQGCEVHMLEWMLNGGSLTTTDLGHHSISLTHVLESVYHVYYFAVFCKTNLLKL